MHTAILIKTALLINYFHCKNKYSLSKMEKKQLNPEIPKHHYITNLQRMK